MRWLLLRRAPLDSWSELEGRRRAVHQGRGDEPDGKYVKDAAYAAVLALEERAQRRRPRAARTWSRRTARSSRRTSEQGKLEPLTIPEYQKKMIGAFDTYIKYVPDAPELVTIKYRKARIYYEYNHFDEAAKLFEDIVGSTRSTSWRSTRPTCCSTPQRAGKTKEVVKLGRQVPRDARAHEGPGVRQADDLAQERHLRHRGPRLREGEELQGVRSLDAGRRRVAARSPEARRAALERRPVLPERPPRRAGAQGARCS